MHELGLLHSVVRAVEKSVPNETRVTAVGLRVGTLSGAVPEALQGAWTVAIAGTSLSAATLDIELLQAAIWCPTCACEQTIDEFYALTCPACGTPCGNLIRGREFEVAYAELE